MARQGPFKTDTFFIPEFLIKFSEIVNKHGIKFIGPSAEIISKMGDKIEAKKIAKKFGLPVIEGSEGGVKSFSEAKSICKNIGYPVLIKGWWWWRKRHENCRGGR